MAAHSQIREQHDGAGLWVWRFDQYVEMGLPETLAADLADREWVSVGEFRGLLRHGASPEQAYRILA